MSPRPVIAILLVLTSFARGQFPSERPFPGIVYKSETRKDPPNIIHWVEVDLADPHVSVRVSPGGADPDGEGRYQTTLMSPSAIAQRERFDLAVNGDFFEALRPRDQLIPGYRADQWAAVQGPAATDGKAWSKSSRKHPALIIHQGARASIRLIDQPPADARQVISGNVMLVEGGKAVKHTNEVRHPRTAVGVDEKGTKLIILVVDGRRAGVSEGMNYVELAAEFVRLGCHAAINLDGGGSTALVMREPAADAYRIINKPSDGKERPVANVLGVRINRLPGENGGGRN